MHSEGTPPPSHLFEQEHLTGLILAGGRARRMGGHDKGLIPLAGRPLIAWVIDALAPQVGRILISANRHQAAYAGFGHPVIGDDAGGADLAGFQGPLAGIAAAMIQMETPWLLTLSCDVPLPPVDLASRLANALALGHPSMPVGSASDGKNSTPSDTICNDKARGASNDSSAVHINSARSYRALGAIAFSNTTPSSHEGMRHPPENARFCRDLHANEASGSNLAVAWDGERLQPIHALLSRALLPDLLNYLAAGERRLEAWQARHHPAIADFSDCPTAFTNLNSPQDVQRLESLLGR